MKVRNLGRKSLEEVIGKLEAVGLSPRQVRTNKKRPIMRRHEKAAPPSLYFEVNTNG